MGEWGEGGWSPSCARQAMGRATGRRIFLLKGQQASFAVRQKASWEVREAITSGTGEAGGTLGLVGGLAGKGLALQTWGLGLIPVTYSHTCNPSSGDIEAGGPLGLPSQPALSQKREPEE